MDLRPVIVASIIVVSQVTRLIIAKTSEIFFFTVIFYAFVQTFLINEWPGYYDFISWYASICTSDKINFALLFVTIGGFIVTFNILKQNRRSEAYTKAITLASDELHQSVQGILTILNKYETYYDSILNTHKKILLKDFPSRDIAFAIEYLSGQKDTLSKESDELGKLINSLFSSSSKNSYLFLLENVNTQHEKLINIATHIHLQCLSVNIIYNKTNYYDFDFFSSQIDQHKIIRCTQLIKLGRECIAKLSGFINGKFISHIAPTRVFSTYFIIKNRRMIAREAISTNNMCIVEKIDKAASDIASDITKKQAGSQSAFQAIEAHK